MYPAPPFNRFSLQKIVILNSIYLSITCEYTLFRRICNQVWKEPLIRDMVQQCALYVHETRCSAVGPTYGPTWDYAIAQKVAAVLLPAKLHTSKAVTGAAKLSHGETSYFEYYRKVPS